MDKQIEEKQKKIDELKKKQKEVKGSMTEVYSRIVGYFRPVSNWNEGKAEEFGRRTTYKVK